MPRVTIPITDGGESRSSSGANTPTIPPFPTRWQGYDHSRHAASDNYGWNTPSTVPRPSIRHHPSDEGGRMQERPRRQFGESVRTGPYGLARFPSQPHSPVQFIIVHEEFIPAVNPGLQFVRDSMPRERGQLHTGFNPMEEPGLTPEEFEKAKSKLKVHDFRSTCPRSSARPTGLFSRSHSNTTASHPAAAAEDADEGKQCTICLDAFVPNQQVLLTPCKHMFHSNCLLPWVKSHGKCPVCRHALVERRENAISTYNGNNTIIPNDETADIVALIMAMDAFRWIHGVR